MTIFFAAAVGLIALFIAIAASVSLLWVKIVCWLVAAVIALSALLFWVLSTLKE